MIKGYKAFEADMTCRGKRYESYKTYEENGRGICKPGTMHFCETPLDCFDYYPILDKQARPYAFAHVKALGNTLFRHGNKRATQKLYIGRKISLHTFIKIGLDKLSEKLTQWSAATTRYGRYMYELLRNTIHAEITENQINASFEYAKARIGIIGADNSISASTSEATIASTGSCNHIATSSCISKIADTGQHTRIATTGGCSKIAALGEDAQIVSTTSGSRYYTSGDESVICCTGSNAVIRMDGKRSIGVATGCFSRVSGKIGDWIVLAEWTLYKTDQSGECVWIPVCVKAVQIDGKILKPNVLYCLRDGNIVEFDEEEGVFPI